MTEIGSVNSSSDVSASAQAMDRPDTVSADSGYVDGLKNHSHTESDIGRTATDTLATSATTADRLASSPTLLDRLSTDASYDASIYSNSDKSVNIARAVAEYQAPGAHLDTEKASASAGAGLSGELTLADVQGESSLGQLATVSGQLTTGTVNAHATLNASGRFNGFSSSATLKASAGAEAMAVDVEASTQISITPKTIGDTLSGAYNTLLDPVVDYVAGRDVAGIPPVPESWDHGLVLGGYIEGGYGVAAKAHAGIELGNGRGLRGSAGIKGNVAPGVVVGFGGTIGFR